MKRLLALFVLVFLLAAVSPAADNVVRGTITSASTDCSTAASCLSIALPPNVSSASGVISGTWSGTAQFEASADGGDIWTAIIGTPWSGGTRVTSTTASGAWSFAVSAKTNLRIRVSTYTSGTPLANLAYSTSA